ncbi:hypothetical protein CPB83DRAFT_765783 [Crepidotus variabilis]|uniref:Uncharacterized protein n=1 Tax=Crepidotus variabilis TaxID=179855 RepID=A0A9P6EHS4_9AGAR|nr:hypothetical protein CPB83DRAFT_765783 [Crepidotus variabilis]
MSNSSIKKVSIIIDDLRGDAFTLSGGGSWTVKKADQWFNGTTQLLESATDSTDPKQLGTLRMSFNGTSVALFGTTPPSSSSQTMSVSIDGSTASNTSYSDPNPQTYRQWYQSPVLADGLHNLTLGNIAGTALDFAVVTVGPDTPLNAQTVIVDNDDPAMVYSKKKGKWRRNMSSFNSGPNPDGFGYGNTTHDTTYVGSSFSYNFSAVSIGVYGVFSWSQVGSLSMEFSIDGNPQKKDFVVTADTPQLKSEVGQEQNFLFYSFDFLLPGVHTLTVNVTDCQNLAFSFDYLTYAPNFATLSAMPDVGIAASDDDGTSGDGDSEKTKSSKGVIIGAVIAAVALLLLITGSAFFLRRRKRRNGGAGLMGKVNSNSKYTPSK